MARPNRAIPGAGGLDRAPGTTEWPAPPPIPHGGGRRTQGFHSFNCGACRGPRSGMARLTEPAATRRARVPRPQHKRPGGRLASSGRRGVRRPARASAAAPSTRAKTGRGSRRHTGGSPSVFGRGLRVPPRRDGPRRDLGFVRRRPVASSARADGPIPAASSRFSNRRRRTGGACRDSGTGFPGGLGHVRSVAARRTRAGIIAFLPGPVALSEAGGRLSPCRERPGARLPSRCGFPRRTTGSGPVPSAARPRTPVPRAA